MEFGSGKSFILVAVGGAVGSLLRYAAAVLLGASPNTTFLVNIAGAFLIGLLVGTDADVKTRLLIGTGVLGGFTTFSAWQLEAVIAVRSHGSPKDGIWILFGSVVAGFFACWLGYFSGERLK